MPDAEVSDDVRAALARLIARLEDASAIAAEAQGVMTHMDAKDRCSQLADALHVMFGERDAIRERLQ